MTEGEGKLLRSGTLSGDGTALGRGPRRALLASGNPDTVQVRYPRVYQGRGVLPNGVLILLSRLWCSAGDGRISRGWFRKLMLKGDRLLAGMIGGLVPRAVS